MRLGRYTVTIDGQRTPPVDTPRAIGARYYPERALMAPPPAAALPSVRPPYRGTVGAGNAAVAVVFAPSRAALPPAVHAWLSARGLRAHQAPTAEELFASAARGRPRVAIIDARHAPEPALAVVARLKRDTFTAVVPAVALVAGGSADAVAAAVAAGADEVLADSPARTAEWTVRLEALLTRSDRDTGVHPSTRLPGAPGIEAEYARRIAAGVRFGVCYVDVDHFKEFNDRYSYRSGDGVIRVLAKILHDVVKGLCGDDGFVGHIGGDDFICIVPADDVAPVCEEIVQLFDTLIPFQYSTPDRTTGYYFGKDRRGQLHRVPLMSVSIGVVTNGRREFTHPAQISELATEMKSYAKTFSGSIYVVDRRHDAVGAPVEAAPLAVGQPTGEGR